MLAATIRASGSGLGPAVQGPVDARRLRGDEQPQKAGIGAPSGKLSSGQGLGGFVPSVGRGLWPPWGREGLPAPDQVVLSAQPLWLHWFSLLLICLSLCVCFDGLGCSYQNHLS